MLESYRSALSYLPFTRFFMRDLAFRRTCFSCLKIEWKVVTLWQLIVCFLTKKRSYILYWILQVVCNMDLLNSRNVCTFSLTVETAAFLCSLLLQRRRSGARSVCARDGKAASYMKFHLLLHEGNPCLHYRHVSLNQQMTKLKTRIGLGEQISHLDSWEDYKLHQQDHYLCP